MAQKLNELVVTSATIGVLKKTWSQVIAIFNPRFGSRKLSNPLGYSAFGYDTANEAEPVKTEIKDEEMADQFAHIKVGETKSEVKTEPGEASSGGASGKFRKKEKKKKKNKHVM